VRRLLSEAENRARAMLSQYRGVVDVLVAALLEEETISGHDPAELVWRPQGFKNACEPPGRSVGSPQVGSLVTSQLVTPGVLAAADALQGY
jgi:hypothetical protein